MARQDLNRLQSMCKAAGKAEPKEWPEGLIGVGPDMRNWVKSQDDAPTKPKSVKKYGKKQESESVEKGE
mgnify:CR=1 FL=1